MKSTCPKCNEIGVRSVYWKPSKSNPRRAYLRFEHIKNGVKTSHYLGRIRTTEEVMKEWNKATTVEEYQKMLASMTKELRTWIYSYSPNRALRKPLETILTKYGY